MRDRPSPIGHTRVVAEPHDVLGVDADASADEITAAFKVLTRVYHPDRQQPEASPVLGPRPKDGWWK